MHDHLMSMVKLTFRAEIRVSPWAEISVAQDGGGMAVVAGVPVMDCHCIA
jgi:hypothetical protein